MDPSLFQLHGLWDMALRFQPNSGERVFSYEVLIAQTSREGSCYVYGEKPSLPPDLIGADARTIETGNALWDIAILDAAYAPLAPHPDEMHTVTGSSVDKAGRRAQLIANEVEHLLGSNLKSRARKVAVIGAIGTLIAALQKRECEVLATDLDRSLVHTQLHGVRIDDGNESTLHHVAAADVAVVTGMALATGTLGQIIEVAKASRTSIVLVAETGSWFAPIYREVFGIDCVVAEPFPFYIFSGCSEVRLFRKRDRK